MSVTQNGDHGGKLSTTQDDKRNGSDVTQNVNHGGNISTTLGGERYGNRAIRRSEAFVVELYLFSIRREPAEIPWEQRIEKAWSQTVKVTRESFAAEYHDAWEERKRQAKKFGIGTYHTGQRIDGEIVYCSTKVVPCWNCNELILLDTSDERLGQYCSDQCRDELYRREQSVSRRRKRAEIRGSRCCDHCSQAYEPKRLGSRFCSTRCRVAANRASKSLGGEQ